MQQSPTTGEELGLGAEMGQAAVWLTRLRADLPEAPREAGGWRPAGGREDSASEGQQEQPGPGRCRALAGRGPLRDRAGEMVG